MQSCRDSNTVQPLSGNRFTWSSRISVYKGVELRRDETGRIAFQFWALERTVTCSRIKESAAGIIELDWIQLHVLSTFLVGATFTTFRSGVSLEDTTTGYFNPIAVFIYIILELFLVLTASSLVSLCYVAYCGLTGHQPSQRWQIRSCRWGQVILQSQRPDCHHSWQIGYVQTGLGATSVGSPERALPADPVPWGFKRFSRVCLQSFKLSRLIWQFDRVASATKRLPY